MARPRIIRMVLRTGVGGSCRCKHIDSGIVPPAVINAFGDADTNGFDAIIIPAITEFDIKYGSEGDRVLVSFGVHNTPQFIQSTLVAGGLLGPNSQVIRVNPGTYHVEFVAFGVPESSSVGQGPFEVALATPPTLNMGGIPDITVDNYILKIPSVASFLATEGISVTDGVGVFDETVLFFDVTDFGGSNPVTGLTEIPLLDTEPQEIDMFRPNISQGLYKVRFYARHVNNLAQPATLTEKSNYGLTAGTYAVAEIPPRPVHTSSAVDPASFALCPQYVYDKEGTMRLPSVAFSEWGSYHDSVRDIESLPHLPIGPGGPFTGMEVLLGVYTNSSRTFFDSGSNPTGLVEYDETGTTEIKINGVGRRYVRMFSRLVNNQSAGGSSLFDADGPYKIDNFEMTFDPVLEAPTLLTIPGDIGDLNTLLFYDLSDPSKYTWQDAPSGTFTDNQERLLVSSHKVDHGQEPGPGFVVAKLYTYGTGPNSIPTPEFFGGIQGHFRVEFQIMHRNTDLDGTFQSPLSDPLVFPDQFTYWMAPDITGQTGAVVGGLDTITLPSSDDITVSDGAFDDPAGYAKTTTVKYEVSTDPGFSSIAETGNLPTAGVEISLPGGSYYVRYQCRYDMGDGSNTVTPWSDYFEDTSNPAEVLEIALIGAGAIAPAGVVVSESSSYNNNELYGVARLFDNSDAEASHTLSSTEPHWYRVDFSGVYVVTSYKLWGNANTLNPDLPSSYQLQGSNDGGATWTAVDDRVNNPPPITEGYTWVSGGAGIPHLDLSVSTPGEYSSYRIYVTATFKRDILRIREMQLLGYYVGPLPPPPPFTPPPGYTQTGDTANRQQTVPDGSSTLTESGIGPSYYFRAIYSISLDQTAGEYTFTGPGINVNSGGETTNGITATGDWVTGQTSYSYASFINDFVGVVRFEIVPALPVVVASYTASSAVSLADSAGVYDATELSGVVFGEGALSFVTDSFVRFPPIPVPPEVTEIYKFNIKWNSSTTLNPYFFSTGTDFAGPYTRIGFSDRDTGNVRFYAESADQVNQFVVFQTAMAENTYYDVEIRRNGINIECYLDGNLAGTGLSRPGVVADPSDDWFIGSPFTAADIGFTGSIRSFSFSTLG